MSDLETLYLASRLGVLQAMNRFTPATLEHFATFLHEAPEDALFRTNPYRYAEESGLSFEEALDLFLYAAHVGVLEITWGILCPSCSSFVTTGAGLRAIQARSSCHFCRIDFEVDGDERVEVVFTVVPTVRRLRFHTPGTPELADWVRLFLSPSVVLNPLLQEHLPTLMLPPLVLQPDTADTLMLTVPAGLYVLMAPAHHAVAYVIARQEGLPSEAQVDLFEGQMTPDLVRLSPGPLCLSVHNHTRYIMLVGLLRDMDKYMVHDTDPPYNNAHLHVMGPYLTGKQLLTSQTFRELFKAESIPSQDGLAFKHLTVLFTDLRGSTALYGTVGDLQAYRLVSEHFVLLRQVVRDHGGAVVKTMGDAIMAVFADPLLALQAALAMHQRIRHVEVGADLQLKIGLHVSPCLAVEADERLDYFGQTVNLAARVQAVAHAGEILCTPAVYEWPGIQEALQQAALTVQQDTGAFKGIRGKTQFYRLLLLR